MGKRAVGLGHAYAPVIEAARDELAKGCNFTRPAPIEVDCAEQFLRLVDRAEMVKFCKDGSDATSGAVRLARAYTGRDMIAYLRRSSLLLDRRLVHRHDPGMPASPTPSSADARFPLQRPGQRGGTVRRPSRPDRRSHPRGHAGRRSEPRLPRGLKRLCHANGALLIFDEMITGFRWHNSGAQTYFGAEPDLSCFGKALGNGFSVSALAGKREYMRLGGLDHTDRPRVFLLSTTHGAETHALAAAIATMKVYESEPVIAHLDKQGRRLRDGAQAVLDGHGLCRHIEIVGRPCCPRLHDTRRGSAAVAGVPLAVSTRDDPARRVDAFAGGELCPFRRRYRPDHRCHRRCRLGVPPRTRERCLPPSRRPAVADRLSRVQRAAFRVMSEPRCVQSHIRIAPAAVSRA